MPGSNLDILIVLREDSRSFLDRTPDYAPDGLPIPADIFPYTLAEIEAGQSLAADALRTGKALWIRTGVDLAALNGL